MFFRFINLILEQIFKILYDTNESQMKIDNFLRGKLMGAHRIPVSFFFFFKA